MLTFPKNIILIGMPGVGKSTVGVLLAKRLGLAFVDTDILIQVREGRSLQALIQAHGAAEFCRIEENHLLSLALTRHVIAPGGSVDSPRAMAHLKANGIAVHLDIAVERLKRRLDDVDARGVVIPRARPSRLFLPSVAPCTSAMPMPRSRPTA